MASILNEYISKNWGLLDLQNELQRLIKDYNKHTGRYLFIYTADINKGRSRGIDVSMVQDDFYNIQDILRESNEKVIDFISKLQAVVAKPRKKSQSFYEKNLTPSISLSLAKQKVREPFLFFLEITSI